MHTIRHFPKTLSCVQLLHKAARILSYKALLHEWRKTGPFYKISTHDYPHIVGTFKNKVMSYKQNLSEILLLNYSKQKSFLKKILSPIRS